MTRTKSTIGVSAVAFFACALLGVACGSSDSTIPGSGGAGSGGASGSGSAGRAGMAGVPGTAGVAGTAGAAGSSTAGGGGTAGVPNNCTPLPTNLLLTDFSPATLKSVSDGASWNAGKQELWGSATSLTGGDVFYQGKAGSAPRVTLHGQTLTVTATIEAGDYAGYMFNFGPKCTNASTTQGLKFDVLEGSTLGNATLKVQMQQKSDYPSTANPSGRPGDCVPTSMATQYNDCLSPGTTVVSSGSTVSPGTTELPWSNFGGGYPKNEIQSDQLMAIQWQFECPPDGGTVSASGGSGGVSGTAGVGGSFAGAVSAGAAGTGGVSSGGAAGASAGSSGDSGSGGTAGSSGSAGSDAGSSGTAGSSAAGSAGTAGSGTAGTSTAGSAGTAGTSTAGSGGSSTSTPPCVVSFTIDNVTFY